MYSIFLSKVFPIVLFYAKNQLIIKGVSEKANRVMMDISLSVMSGKVIQRG